MLLDTFQARIDSLGLDILVGNFGYFLLGYYLNITDIGKKARRCIYAMGIAALLLTPFLTVQDCIKSGTYVEKWFSPGSLNILIMTIAIFVCFRYGKAFEQVKERIYGQSYPAIHFSCTVNPRLERIQAKSIRQGGYKEPEYNP